jgi:hypothetical protein
MTENHNQAMALAEGQYICLIGDDDTILPEALEAARWAAIHDVAAIAPEVVVNYAWPDFRSRAFGTAHAGRVYMKRHFGTAGWRFAHPDKLAALSRAALGTDGLPKVYHGLVARSVLQRVQERSGAYFHGTSPDVSGAMGVAEVIDRYVWIDYPLTLPGASAGSNTGRSATKTHTGSLEDDPHTRRFRNLIWPEVLPRFVSVETVWAQAVYSTLMAMQSEALPTYNMPRLYAVCLFKSPSYYRLVYLATKCWSKQQRVSLKTLWLQIIAEYVSVSVAEIWTLAKRVSKPTAAGGRLYRDGIADIAACEQAYRELLREADPRPSLQELLDALGGMH